MNRFCNDVIIACLIAIVVLVPLFFDTKIYSVFDLSKITLLYILSFSIVAAWSIKRIFDSSGKFEFNALTLPITGLLVVGFLATIFSIDPVKSLLGGYKRYNGLFSLFIYIFLFFTIVHYVKAEMIDLFLNVIIFSACISSIYGLCQYYDLIGGVKWSTDYGRRMFSTIGHPAFYSAYLIMVLPLVYYKIIVASTKGGKCSGATFIGGCCILVLMLITFYFTKTRASFIGLVLSNICFLVLIGKNLIARYKYRLITIFSIVMVITLFATFGTGKNPVSRIVKEIKVEGSKVKLSGTAHTRYYNVLIAMEIIKDYPILGIGNGNMSSVYPYYVNEILKKPGGKGYVFREIQDRVHSSPFDTLVTMGIIGGLVSLWFLYSYTRMIWCSLNVHRILIAALCSGVVAFWVQNLFSFGHIPIITLFWFLIAFSVIACRKTKYAKQIS